MKALHQTSYMHLTEKPMVVYSDCHILSGFFLLQAYVLSYQQLLKECLVKDA